MLLMVAAVIALAVKADVVAIGTFVCGLAAFLGGVAFLVRRRGRAEEDVEGGA
jgi:hypothetical protein